MKIIKYLRQFRNGRVQTSLLVVADVLVILLSSFLSLYISFDCSWENIDPVYWTALIRYFPISLICTMLIFFCMRLYSHMWKFAGITEFINIMLACVVSSLVQMVGMHWGVSLYIPKSYFVISFMVMTSWIFFVRYSYKLSRVFTRIQGKGREYEKIRTMVIGAGSAGSIIVKEIKESKLVERVVPCILDDDPKKIGGYLCGVPIVGGRDRILEYVRKYGIEEIFIAIPSISGKEQKKILDICQTTGCRLSIMPGLYQLMNQEVNISTLREIEIDDLLGRDPVRVDLESIMGYVQGQTVLVTGGGGSIGSELCRQIAKYGPKQLIILDNYENNAYVLQMELKKNFPGLPLVVLIASVQNEHRIYTIFEKYKPDLIYHAAAHKHVPLMEYSPCEAIKNNVFGTFHVAAAAERIQAKRMVLISTDKAVRPTNIMGASKRICEMIVQHFAQHSSTEYVAVRFGNVLGSNGSVIPLFKKQIAEGGPITVTDPRIIRYFMTIPEAVSLVLQAGAYAKGGEIFILDMGEPVKILDLAENLIRLSGKKPYEDIDIEFIGLRPGEKLYEELLIDEENKKKTENSRIFIGTPSKMEGNQLLAKLSELKERAYQEDKNIKDLVKELVPEYKIYQEQEMSQEIGAEHGKEKNLSGISHYA